MNVTDVTLQVAIIGAFVTFFGSLLAFIVAIIRERFEREKWQRDRQFEREKWERTQQLEESKWQKTLALEDQRVRHEENQWLLDLNNDREREMLKWRMATYPPIFTALGRLSRHHLQDLPTQDATMLADELNGWGYGEAGLAMLPETREALFILRDWLHAYAQGKVSARPLARGPRTDFLELLRRDLGHSSLWRRNYAELLKQNRDRINQILEIKADLQEQED